MVKSALKLKCKVSLPSLQYTLVIGIKLNIFVPIVAIHFIFGRNEKRSPSINATMTDAPPF
jgi:hypothetical protein